jgi:TPR repeat protein
VCCAKDAMPSWKIEENRGFLAVTDHARERKGSMAVVRTERAKREWFEKTETARSFLACMPNKSRALLDSLKRATFLVGTMYLHGCGVPRNTAVAGRMLLDAANLGDTHAIILLAEMYPVQKFELYARAAELGHEHAQLWVACMYQEGIEVAHDEQAALRWYRAAAEQGNKCASLRIAQMFVEGAVHFKVAPEEVS